MQSLPIKGNGFPGLVGDEWMVSSIEFTSCCDGTPELVAQLCGDCGVTILKEIVKTAAAVDFGEDWYKLLLSIICLVEPYFRQLFRTCW